MDTPLAWTHPHQGHTLIKDTPLTMIVEAGLVGSVWNELMRVYMQERGANKSTPSRHAPLPLLHFSSTLTIFLPITLPPYPLLPFPSPPPPPSFPSFPPPPSLSLPCTIAVRGTGQAELKYLCRHTGPQLRAVVPIWVGYKVPRQCSL